MLHQSSRGRHLGNHNQSMGWMGELSSIVFSMGHKLIQGGDKWTSDSASEVLRLDAVDVTYRPRDLTLIEQRYRPVEPSDLISK